MNIDQVNELRNAVAQQAADLKWLRIPQLQIPVVEYAVPSGEDAESALSDLRWRISTNPNLEARLATRGPKVRIRVEYRT